MKLEFEGDDIWLVCTERKCQARAPLGPNPTFEQVMKAMLGHYDRKHPDVWDLPGRLFWTHNVVHGSPGLPIPLYSHDMPNREIAVIGLEEAISDGKTNPKIRRQLKGRWEDDPR